MNWVEGDARKLLFVDASFDHVRPLLRSASSPMSAVFGMDVAEVVAAASGWPVRTAGVKKEAQASFLPVTAQ
ncbi:MAG: hypothetical protein ACSLEZ_01550 [Thiobacillus sp.]